MNHGNKDISSQFNNAMPPLPAATSPRSLSEKTIERGYEVLSGKRTGIAAYLPFLGPALIASIAYMDPGNFATNVEAGAKLNMKLLWVVMMANIIAMLFQALSAKLGLVTDRSLAQNCRHYFSKPICIAMWLLSECAAMATDLAEFLGAALGISLLFHISLMLSLVLTAALTWLILQLINTQFRLMEYVIALFIIIIGVSYLCELVITPPHWGEVAQGLIPSAFDSHESILLSIGIIGATVMPHALYLHSSLTQSRIPARTDDDRSKLISFSHREIILALGVAGLINLAMVIMSANVFHDGHQDIADVTSAYQTLTPLLGYAAAHLFLIALIASGLSSSIVGTLAGQTIMQDFVHFRTPLWLRRLITMLPAFVIVQIGYDVTDALVMSQAILSLLLPVPLISLIWLTSQDKVMGQFKNSLKVSYISLSAMIIIIGLNILYLASLAGLDINHPF